MAINLVGRVFRPEKQPPAPDPDTRIEEQTLGHYSRRVFYPVKIGETLVPRDRPLGKHRYKVLGKFGWGSFATVWFCKDKR